LGILLPILEMDLLPNTIYNIGLGQCHDRTRYCF
jgi:hypothetical protein